MILLPSLSATSTCTKSLFTSLMCVSNGQHVLQQESTSKGSLFPVYSLFYGPYVFEPSKSFVFQFCPVARAKNSPVTPEAFSPLITITIVTFVKLVTGHLQLQTRSIPNLLSSLDQWMFSICRTFLEAK